MQDNLEFLQWAKRYWDKYFPGGDYDALGRRKASGTPAGPPAAMGGGTRRPAGGAAPRTRTPQMSGGASAALQSENNALKETVGGLERERDFYFSKLRDIELLIQQEIEAHPELEQLEDGILKQIQTILYSTEVSGHNPNIRLTFRTNNSIQEGFEIPQEVEGEVGEEETF
jgi:RP/EB family microtubule-associated protein